MFIYNKYFKKFSDNLKKIVFLYEHKINIIFSQKQTLINNFYVSRKQQY